MPMLMLTLIPNSSVPAVHNAMSTKCNDINAMPSRDAYRILYIDMHPWMLHTSIFTLAELSP